jgi:uncharacterized membrane protein YeaQ/YmgE (transglycosylase-associated protein family)
MKNPKVIIIAAVAGFFLSFITALISGAGLVAAPLKGFVSAAVCAVVVASLSFAARKLLLENVPAAETDEARESSGTGGSIVNIVLDDEKLPVEPDDPLFNVSDIGKSLGKPLAGQGYSRQTPAASDAEARPVAVDAASLGTARKEPAENKAADGQASSAGFTPANIMSVAASAPVQGFTKDAAESFARKMDTPQTLAHTAELAAKSASARNGFQGAGLIDLPDIGMFVTEGLSTDDDVIKDTEFASATKDEVAVGHKIRAPEDIDISDSKAIASAIRTLLVNE